MYLKNRQLTLSEKQPGIRGEKLEVVVAYADIRGFSQWSLKASATQVIKVIEIVYDRVIQLAFFYKHTFHKFLGDGFVLVWEVADHGSPQEALYWALSASFEIHKRYWYMTQYLNFETPPGFGIGLACGSVVRVDPETFIPELNEPDFVGYPMNCGARMQKLAGPYGTVIDSTGVKHIRQKSDRVLREKNPIIALELAEPEEASIALAHRLTGLRHEDVFGFRYISWPYLQKTLWKTNGHIV